MRGFDIRSSDEPCHTCDGPVVVSNEEDLVTICDGDRCVYEHFEVPGDHRYFRIGSDRRVLDTGSLQELVRPSEPRRPGANLRRHRAMPEPLANQADSARQSEFDGSSRLRHASK